MLYYSTIHTVMNSHIVAPHRNAPGIPADISALLDWFLQTYLKQRPSNVDLEQLVGKLVKYRHAQYLQLGAVASHMSTALRRCGDEALGCHAV